ncbi:MAG: hypothetical protein LC658_08045 [Bacteroidales bacterium]|nr:hypothetical protein [Bacteroidales bacterium]
MIPTNTTYSFHSNHALNENEAFVSEFICFSRSLSNEQNLTLDKLLSCHNSMARCTRLTARLNDLVQAGTGRFPLYYIRQMPDKLSDYFAWGEVRPQKFI